jgi:acyl transferase domain-containing protein
MFTGQGAQYVDMARELYETEASFREDVDHCCEILEPHLCLDLRTVLYPSAERANEASEQLKQTQLTQAALFVIEYALAQLWMRWGVRPAALLGHSIGEYVAACFKGCRRARATDEACAAWRDARRSAFRKRNIASTQWRTLARGRQRAISLCRVGYGRSR